MSFPHALCCSDMEDLRSRIGDAVAQLTEMMTALSLTGTDPAKHKRLSAKRSGLLLALDYIRVYEDRDGI